MGYYSDEEDIDIRVTRGRASPAFDHRSRHNSYYTRGETRLEVARGGYERSRSRGYDREIERERIIRERPVVVERERPVVIEREKPVFIERERPAPRERAVTPQPIVINNIMRQDEEEYEERDRYGLQVVSHTRTRSRSRRRDSEMRETGYMTKEEYELESARKELERYKLEKQREGDENMKKARETGYMTKEEYELENARKELERYKLEKQREEDENVKKVREAGYMTKEKFELERARKELEKYKQEKQREEDENHMKKELELKRLKEEKKAEEEKKAKKEAEERAIKEYKAKEAEKREKEEKEKKERDAEYKKRLEEDLRKSGMDEKQIAIVLKKDKDGAADPNRPTYTRMARRYLSIETLRELRIDYTVDTDPEYILIKRWVPEYEQDYLWTHTRELRELRERQRQPVVLAIEEKKHKHHSHRDDEFEIVRKHKRKTSPSPLVTFFAGGKR